MAIEITTESSNQSSNLSITIEEATVGVVYSSIDNLGNVNSGFNITNPEIAFSDANNATEVTNNIHTAIDEFLAQAKTNHDSSQPSE